MKKEDGSMSRKQMIFWVICYVISVGFLAIVFPISIFIIGAPFCFIVPAIYIIGGAVLSVLAFRRSERQSLMKKILFGYMLVPMMAYALIVISVGAGWLQWC
jgi:hypothetical protein